MYPEVTSTHKCRGYHDNYKHLGLSQFKTISLLKTEDTMNKKLLMRRSKLNISKYTFVHKVFTLFICMVYCKIQLFSWIFQTERTNSFWINYGESYSSLQSVNLMDITYLLLNQLKICNTNWDAWFIVILSSVMFDETVLKRIYSEIARSRNL